MFACSSFKSNYVNKRWKKIKKSSAFQFVTNYAIKKTLILISISVFNVAVYQMFMNVIYAFDSVHKRALE